MYAKVRQRHIFATEIEILMLQIFFSEDFSRNLSGGIQETNTHLLFSL